MMFYSALLAAAIAAAPISTAAAEPYFMRYAELYVGEGPQEGDEYTFSKADCYAALDLYLRTPNPRKIVYAFCIPVKEALQNEDPATIEGDDECDGCNG